VAWFLFSFKRRKKVNVEEENHMEAEQKVQINQKLLTV